jgi:hypothetical protein
MADKNAAAIQSRAAPVFTNLDGQIFTSGHGDRPPLGLWPVTGRHQTFARPEATGEN